MKKLISLIFVIYLTCFLNHNLTYGKICNSYKNKTDLSNEYSTFEEINDKLKINSNEDHLREEFYNENFSYIDLIYDLDRFYNSNFDTISNSSPEIKNTIKERLNILNEKIEIEMVNSYFEEFYDF